MSEENKVHIKLEKQYLASEREERRQKKIRRFLTFLACLIFLIIGLLIGYFGAGGMRQNTISDKLEEVKYYLKNSWLYSNDYEDLDTFLNDKALYGMTDFEDDPYTSYMSKDELDEFASNINMDYVGVGVQYSNLDSIATITRVFKGSPAERDGLEVGDVIKKVDGVEISGFESDKIKELVTGEEGTYVTFTVNRAGQDIDVKVQRGSIESTVYAYSQDDYVILELMSFGVSTAEECIRYLDDYRDYKKIIIDMRDNSGGYQNAVIDVAGLFLGKDKSVMDQITNSGKKTTYKTSPKVYYDNFEKIVVLTNNYTASAAEVLTICLKEVHPNTTIVGEKTFGKGVVQSNYLLSNGEAAIKMTTSKWLSPNGVWVNGEGISPDYEVFLDDVFYYEGEGMEENEVFEFDDVADQVSLAQMSLDFLGYDVSRTDGYFDEELVETLKVFQKEHSLKETGTLNQETFVALLSKTNRVFNSDKTTDKQLMKAIEIIKQ